MACRILKAKVAADLIAKVRKAQGWPRVEGDSLRVIRRMNELYDVRATREGQYVATPKCGSEPLALTGGEGA